MQEKINRGNYEVFLIDFLEENLDSETHAQVLFFLENNPDIAEEFNGISDFDIQECYASYDEKEDLKRRFEKNILINADNYEHYFIAYHEGDLSADEKIQVEDFIDNNPSLNKDFELYGNLRYNTDNSIVFEEIEFVPKSIFLINGISFDEKHLISKSIFTFYRLPFFVKQFITKSIFSVDGTTIYVSYLIAKSIFPFYRSLTERNVCYCCEN